MGQWQSWQRSTRFAWTLAMMKADSCQEHKLCAREVLGGWHPGRMWLTKWRATNVNVGEANPDPPHLSQERQCTQGFWASLIRRLWSSDQVELMKANSNWVIKLSSGSRETHQSADSGESVLVNPGTTKASEQCGHLPNKPPVRQTRWAFAASLHPHFNYPSQNNNTGPSN